ncbi:MAG: MerR family transcriptional regulator [Planctomycetota bacterium]
MMYFRTPARGGGRLSPPERGGFSIGDIAKATGIGADTIRSWERKFGRPQPTRLPSGHRRYSEHDLAWMRRVAEALARGHRAGVAVRASDAELADLLGSESEAARDPEIGRVLGWIRGSQIGDLRDHLHQLWDANEPVEFLEYLAGLSQAVGRAWVEGSLEIRHEHYFSGVLEDFLRARRGEFPACASDPIVVLATLPGERHSLGLQMAALVCAWRCCSVHILGTEAPVAEIARSARELESFAVGVGVSLATAGVETDRMLRDLRRLLPETTDLVVGGPTARQGRWGIRGAVYLKTLHDLAAWLKVHRKEKA